MKKNLTATMILVFIASTFTMLVGCKRMSQSGSSLAQDGYLPDAETTEAFQSDVEYMNTLIAQDQKKYEASGQQASDPGDAPYTPITTENPVLQKYMFTRLENTGISNVSQFYTVPDNNNADRGQLMSNATSQYRATFKLIIQNYLPKSGRL